MPTDPSTLGELLRRQVHARGDRTLLVCDADRIDYATAGQRSAELARGLIALGAGKGTHIGLLYPNGIDFVIAMLAAARIGAVVVPFSTFAPGPELHTQLVHSDVRILLATSGFRSHDYAERLRGIVGTADLTGPLFSPAVPQLRHVLIGRLPTEAVTPELLRALEDDVDGCDPLAIIYTSGSSGAPKGVVHTHAALLGHQNNLNRIRGLTAADTLFCNSPFFWIGGFGFALLASMLAGATLVCSNATDAGVTLDLLDSEKPTLTNGFVAGIAHLAQHPSFAGRDFSALRRGNLYPIMAPSSRPADPELRHNMLGMTETGSVVLLSDDESDQPEHRRGSFGKPAPGFDTRILDPDTGQPVATGDVGELCVRGPYLMQRYYKRSREECFDADGWFRTGDLVRVDPDGFHYFVGRRGAMIKTAGANVAPAEVEKAIAKATGGLPAYVIGLPDARRGQLVAAAIVVDDPRSFDTAALRLTLKAELSSYKVPARIVAVAPAQLPPLPSGKVDTQRLRQVFCDD